jgi:methanogenic corrinoid protein MtbC1
MAVTREMPVSQAIHSSGAETSGAGANFISTIVYRSRAIRPLTPPALHQLTTAAQARNSREAITGLMLYDQGQFFQWLEGPPDSVGRVMGSIYNDSRHTDIEVINSQETQKRTFGDWSMKLAVPGLRASSMLHDVIEPPRDVVKALRKRPDEASSLLMRLVSVSVDRADVDAATDTVARIPLRQSTAAILKSVILANVIPELAVKRGISAEQIRIWQASNRTAELADLLIGSDHDAAIELLKEMHDADDTILSLYATLFEPAARRLGDLWSEDLCSELDVTLALARLQAARCHLTMKAKPLVASFSPKPVVLIAPEPGELHQLGAALDSDVMWNAGWSPHRDYPADLQALQDLLSVTWFDVLDLSLSAAFRRDHRLPGLARTIADARHASLNPTLLVVVGGRIFAEDDTAISQVGADVATRTAVDVDQSIMLGIDTVKAARKRKLN